MRLGDLDALKKEIVDLKLKLRSQNQDYYTGYICALSVVEGLIAHSPTIDAPPVVRCKDCKHSGGLMGRPPFMFYICTCAEGLTGAVRDENFCSYGERKDGEG